MKITKKAFIEAMTSNATAFCGITKRLYSSDEVYCAIQDILKPAVILEARSCQAYSKGLEFSGGSILSLDQHGNYEFFRYKYPEGVVYVCHHGWIDSFDDALYEKAMYYLVKN